MRDDVTGSWTKLHSIGLYEFYSPQNIKSRRRRWAEQVAHKEDMRNTKEINLKTW